MQKSWALIEHFCTWWLFLDPATHTIGWGLVVHFPSPVTSKIKSWVEISAAVKRQRGEYRLAKPGIASRGFNKVRLHAAELQPPVLILSRAHAICDARVCAWPLRAAAKSRRTLLPKIVNLSQIPL